jgi:glycosyltransferase involved in cell wall biosynthesis
VTFLSRANGKRVNDRDMAEQLSSAEAFLFASFDDAGIAPIEALAAGTPVIAYKAGGALDYVVPGKTGAFFDDQTPESLISTLKAFNPKNYRASEVSKFADQFSTVTFARKMREFLGSLR